MSKALGCTRGYHKVTRILSQTPGVIVNQHTGISDSGNREVSEQVMNESSVVSKVTFYEQ